MKLYRSPGGYAIYTESDVEHLMRFYPAQRFERVPWWDVRARWRNRK